MSHANYRLLLLTSFVFHAADHLVESTWSIACFLKRICHFFSTVDPSKQATNNVPTMRQTSHHPRVCMEFLVRGKEAEGSGNFSFTRISGTPSWYYRCITQSVHMRILSDSSSGEDLISQPRMAILVADLGECGLGPGSEILPRLGNAYPAEW